MGDPDDLDADHLDAGHLDAGHLDAGDLGPDPTECAQAEAVVAAVLAANQAFYDAHEARDLAAMDAIWEHSDRVVCIHPGWPVLRRWPEVRDSWQRILDGPGRNQFIITNDAVSVDGDLAWVTCDENLVAPGATGTIAATNLFARSTTGGRWRLILHHGSPVYAR